MSDNQTGLIFTMSYSEALDLSYEKQAFLTRDQVDLAPRGITVARIAAFAGLRNAFASVPQDETMVANISIAINNRNADVDSMYVAIREVWGIAKTTFGDGSAEYKSFKPGDITRVPVADLGHLGRTVVSQGNIYLTQMQPKGLTAAMLSAITTLITNLDTKILAVSDAEGARETSTQTRHIAANAMFSEMRDMCDIARVYWADRNPLKASQYVIYDEPGSSQQRNGIIAPGTVVYREFTGLNVDAAFKIRISEGNDLAFYFSQTEGGSTTGATITVPVDPNNYTDVVAAAMGYDAATGYIKFNIRNNGSVESSYRVVME